MIKKIVACVAAMAAAVAFAVSPVQTPLFAATEVSATTLTSGDYEYSLRNDNTAEITRYNGSASTVNVPSEIDGYSVASIGKLAFYETGVTSITLPNGLKTIDSYAFGLCQDLQTINIPDSVTSIGKLAFYYTDIKSISIPDGVTKIEEGVFSFCSSLSEVTIGNGVERIKMQAFAECTSLRNITIPDNVTKIDEFAFFGCSSMTNAFIGRGVTSIGDSALGYDRNKYGGPVHMDAFSIECYSGTAAEQYAIDNDFSYSLVTGTHTEHGGSGGAAVVTEATEAAPEELPESVTEPVKEKAEETMPAKEEAPVETATGAIAKSSKKDSAKADDKDEPDAVKLALVSVMLLAIAALISSVTYMIIMKTRKKK